MTPIQNTAAGSWNMALNDSFHGLWFQVISFLPNIFAALVLFVVGILISISLGILITKILEKMKLDQASESIGLSHLLAEGEIKVSLSEIIGGAVKWFLILVFLTASTETLGLHQITDFLTSILLYIPNVIVAAIILALSIIIANFIDHLIKKSGKATKLTHAHIIGAISKWAVIIFGVLTALSQLGIAKDLISTLFAGVVGMLALAGGLAFGLGGQDKAREILDQLIKIKK